VNELFEFKYLLEHATVAYMEYLVNESGVIRQTSTAIAG